MPSLSHALNTNDLFAEVDVRSLVTPLMGSLHDLSDDERRAVEKAVPKRQREFATGRTLVRSILGDMDVHEFSLINDADRVPIWPDGYLGSISHCEDACFVAIGRTDEGLMGLGIDVEPDEPLEAELWETLGTPEELNFIKSQAEFDPGRLMRLLYSAKEAVYKCFYPTIRQPLEFSEVVLNFPLS
ncbi:MAG: 4'-phosphopantetheinyl transferase superfamily protein, partial [Planctomycetota bacterium]|nr:4'-phosphopantetheinyl transferase superfamily protein [Planctomycetota bacterium]